MSTDKPAKPRLRFYTVVCYSGREWGAMFDVKADAVAEARQEDAYGCRFCPAGYRHRVVAYKREDDRG